MPNAPLTWSQVDTIADHLGVSEATRRKWRQTGRRVPWKWRVQIVEEMAKRNLRIPIDAFDQLEPTPGRIAA